MVLEVAEMKALDYIMLILCFMAVVVAVTFEVPFQ